MWGHTSLNEWQKEILNTSTIHVFWLSWLKYNSLYSPVINWNGRLKERLWCQLYFIDLGKVANFIILLLQIQKTRSAVLSFFFSFFTNVLFFIFYFKLCSPSAACICSPWWHHSSPGSQSPVVQHPRRWARSWRLPVVITRRRLPPPPVYPERNHCPPAPKFPHPEWLHLLTAGLWRKKGEKEKNCKIM